MPEIVNLNVSTITTIIGSDLTINTFYVSGSPPDILSSQVTNTTGSLSGVSFVEGELLIESKIGTTSLSFFLNPDGTFSIDSTDSANYSINSDGELIYTT
jgi:hypothetical protein